MSNVVQLPLATTAAAQAAVSQDAISDEARSSFQAKAFKAYRDRCSARGLTDEYAQKCLDSVGYILRWSGKALSDLTESDYEAWTFHLAHERKLKLSTQRTYQKGIRQTFGFWTKRQELQNQSMQAFGSRIELIAHADNSISHVVEDETQGRRPPLSHEEMDLFLRAVHATSPRFK